MSGTRLAIGLALSCAAVACSAGSADRRPNVILVSVDTLRADALGVYGGVVPTPVLDRLAGEGVLFEMALAPAALTAPSHVSLLTGREPLRHGVIRNGVVLAPDLELLSEVFQQQGYATGAFVSSFVLDPRFGWGQGFDAFDASFSAETSTVPRERGNPGMFFHKHDFDGFDRRADAAVEAALEWLAQAPEPWFLFLHLFDPHDPYVPPERFESRVPLDALDVEGRTAPGARRPGRLARLVRRYHAEVLFVDEQLGRLFEAVDARSARDRLTVVTADHGEGLGQHGWLYHDFNLYDEALRVPLIVHDSRGVAAGARISTPVGLIDVAPTLAELAGLPALARADGRSLAASVRKGVEPPSRPIFAHRREHRAEPVETGAEKLAVRAPGWKLIRSLGQREELYDLVSDAAELRDRLAQGDRQEALRLAELTALLDAHLAARAGAGDESELTDEVREALRALGYTD